MKRVIILLVMFLGLAYWSSTVAQVMAEKTVVKRYNSENRTELTGMFVGNFNKLNGVWGTDNIQDTLQKYFHIGFYFGEQNIDNNYYNSFIPAGYVAWIKRANPSDVDTVVVKTDLTNIQKNLNYYTYSDIVQKPNVTDNTVVKFRVDGTENEGQAVQDLACEPQMLDKRITSEQWNYERFDTVTFYAPDVSFENWCDTNYTYDWWVELPDSVDSLNNAVTYKEPFRWNDTRQGWISGDQNQITFEVLFKGWNDRKFYIEVTNSLGTVKSWKRLLKVNQGE